MNHLRLSTKLYLAGGLLIAVACGSGATAAPATSPTKIAAFSF